MFRSGQEEIDAITRVINSRQWFRYPLSPDHPRETAHFEAERAAHFGVTHACFLTSGTAALAAATAGLALGPGDEVIIPGYTWLASALAPLALGVIPVIVDIDESLTISPAAIGNAITPRTRAIYPVHINGLACDMTAILAIAKKHNLFVVEDACQADGGLWSDGRKLGSLGDFGTLSFNAYKVISCGEGGAIVSNNPTAFERAVLYNDAGSNFFGRENALPMFAGKINRGNEILAAMMRAQLARLPSIIADLHANRRLLDAALADLPNAVKLLPRRGGPDTGTATATGLTFPAESAARSFVAALRANPTAKDLPTTLPIDSPRHVYANWDILNSRRGSYHPDLDPFRHPRNAHCKIDYRPDLLPATLAILARTVLIHLHPDWTPQQIAAYASVIRSATGARHS